MLYKRRCSVILLVILTFSLVFSAAAAQSSLTESLSSMLSEGPGISGGEVTGEAIKDLVNEEITKAYEDFSSAAEEIASGADFTHDRETAGYIFRVFYRSFVCLLFLTSVIFLAIDCVARAKLLDRSGGGGWKIIIPFYGRYLEYKRYWIGGLYWTYLILWVGVLFSYKMPYLLGFFFVFAVAAFHLAFRVQFYKSFGRDPILILVDIFGMGILADIILAFSECKYIRCCREEPGSKSIEDKKAEPEHILESEGKKEDETEVRKQEDQDPDPAAEEAKEQEEKADPAEPETVYESEEESESEAESESAADNNAAEESQQSSETAEKAEAKEAESGG